MACSLFNYLDKSLHRQRVCSELLHGFQVHFKMASGFAKLIDVAFLSMYDLINKPCQNWILPRCPGYGHGSQADLQGFQQRHEIPNRKHMRLHKDFDIINR